MRDNSRHGQVTQVALHLDPAASRVKTLRRVREEAVGAKLEGARVVVTGGYGVGIKENFSLIQDLARLLGGAVGASRPLVDAGWLPLEHQVGQTGQTVAPKLYIACGISGALQHAAGMKNAELIVAVNTDPSAMIFNISHIGIVADLREFLPILIAQLKP